MPKAKNLGPCVIPECNYENTRRFRKMTSLAIGKVKNKHPEGSYNFIEEGNELCHEHYMKIVESDIHEKYKNKSLEISQTKINDLSESKEDESDWTKIKINLVDDNVILSKDDFRNIISHINNLELQINENSYYIDENNDDFDVNNEISNGNLLILYFYCIINY